MAQPIQFFVDDTSPSISYFPFGDTFSTPNASAGWNPYFNISGFPTSQGETGNGTSFHTTSLSGASLSVQWQGTGIQLLGAAAPPASFEIFLDGTPILSSNTSLIDNILATFQDLVDANHTITLTTQIPANQDSQFIFFDKALIIASTPPSSSINATFTKQAINNSDVAFLGQWTFQNSFHRSTTRGDRAQAIFNGTSFLLNGKTSPVSGRYSVTLDNVTTTLSGRSSFTQQDSLLFFASGLNPNTTHNVEIVNEDDDGDLSLIEGGFQVFATGTPTPALPSSAPPSPPPSPASSLASHPKGTIAALVLAGILAFLLLTGFLFFCFVIRPRRRRRIQAARQEPNKNEREVGKVLDIGPEPGGDMEFGSIEVNAGHRTSGRSGFARWKKEVEGGLTGLGIGIVFRHSGSTARSGYDAESEPLSTKSSHFTASSKNSRRKGKKKGKGKHNSDGSWTPSFALELPIRPPSSADSHKDVGRSQRLPHSLSSGLTSLSYMSTPPPPAKNIRIAPPAYSDSSSGKDFNSTSSPHSVPRSISHSPQIPLVLNSHARTGSEGLLLIHGDPDPGSPDGNSTQEYEPFVATLSPPDSEFPVSITTEDRGSIQYSTDDATSVLGSAAIRLALRGLSPRTSEYPEKHGFHGKRDPPLRHMPEIPQEQGEAESSRDNVSDSRGSSGDRSLGTGVRLEIPHPQDSSFLNVRASSPFQVEFPTTLSQQHRESDTSYVGFGQGSLEGNADKEKTKASEEQRAEQSQPPAPKKKRSIFRLTPPSNPPNSSRGRSDSTSFLDFSNSSDASNRSYSPGRDRQAPAVSISRQLSSRWSNTFSQTTDLSRSDSSNASVPPTVRVAAPHSVFSGAFPYPISLPLSSRGPDSQARSISATALQRQSQQSHSAGVHPHMSVGSPTDSVPASVSEIRFRHSDSTEETHASSARSHLPPHPPLPGRETHENSGSATPALSAASYVLQRSLGQSPIISPAAITHSSSVDASQPRNEHNES